MNLNIYVDFQNSTIAWHAMNENEKQSANLTSLIPWKYSGYLFQYIDYLNFPIGST